MKPEPLLAAFAKIEWANSEIENLHTSLSQFFADEPYERRPRLNSDKTRETWSFKLTKKLPPVFNVRTGNILKNLREPLDNLVAALADQRRVGQTDVGWPFGKSIQAYDAAILRLQKSLPAGAADLIRSAKTHPGDDGNKYLRALHFLNRDDKHRWHLVPVSMMHAIHMSSLLVYSGEVVRLGFERGTHLVPGPGGLVAPPGSNVPLVVRNGVMIRGADGQPANLFVPEPGDDDMEYLVVSRGALFECDAKPVLDVAFRDIPGLEREPAIVVLKEISKLVNGILLTFERRFFR